MTDPAQLPDGALHIADGTVIALVAPHAGLIELPASISEMTALRRIDLDGNALTHLPAEIAALPLLDTLLVYGNRLTDIPRHLVRPLRCGISAWAVTPSPRYLTRSGV